MSCSADAAGAEADRRALAELPAWARNLLAEGRIGRLATVAADGQPSVVAVCYALVGGLIYSPIDGKPKGSRRLRRLCDLDANPRVAMVVDRWDEDWRELAWVTLRGRGVVVEMERAEAAGDRRAALAALRSKYPQYGSTSGPPPPDGAPLADDAPLIRIEIDQARCWRASDGAER